MELNSKSSFMPIDTSEQKFEEDIETALISEGYRKISRNDYDTESLHDI